MSITKPFHRNYRGRLPGQEAGYSDWGYIHDREYANSPGNYVRAYLIIQSDLQRLFEYIEPSPESLPTYSYRIHELLMRTCIEIEANFKAILAENLYTPAKDRNGHPILNIGVYKKINVTHHLSSYSINLPIWNGPTRILSPFAAWGSGRPLPWYQAYNASKHDRHEEFKRANLDSLISAVGALLIILSAQFRGEDFSAEATGLALEGYDYHDMDASIGGMFRIKYPDDWDPSESYDFDWSTLKADPDRFDRINYDLI
jgi:hypothetical protein